MNIELFCQINGPTLTNNEKNNTFLRRNRVLKLRSILVVLNQNRAGVLKAYTESRLLNTQDLIIL